MEPNELNSIVGILEGIQMSGMLTVTVKDDYPSAGSITLICESNDKPTQQVTWAKGTGTYIISDTTTEAGKTWSSSKINTELSRRISEPTTEGTAGQALITDGSGGRTWGDVNSPVISVNSKTGVVVLTAADLSTYTSAQIDTALAGKANVGDSYTKAEDDLLLADKANNSDVYNRGTIDGLLASKASISDVYDKTTSDTLLAAKANSADVYTKGEVYTKSAVYKKAETYSNDEVNTLVGGRIEEPSGTRSYGVSPIANSDGSLTWQKLVERVNGKNGNITLNSADINMVSGTETIEAAINSKINQPATAGTVGQVLTKTATGEAWQTPISAPVHSVNSMTGDVVLAADDIKMADGTTTVEAAIGNKFNKPTGSATIYRAIVSDGAGGSYWYDIVNKVNGKHGYVELKGSDIKVSSADTRNIDVALSNCLTGVKVNGTELSVSDNKVNIPVASGTDFGVVKTDETKGIKTNAGILELSSAALENINAAHSSINAEEYDETKMYYVGDYTMYKGYMYVCKAMTTGLFTTAAFKLTNETKEINNLLAQLIAAVGLKEGSARTWDDENGKIIYHFDTV